MRIRFFGVFAQNEGFLWCQSDRGDEGSMCHFKEIEFGLKNRVPSIQGPNLVPKRSQNVPKMLAKHCPSLPCRHRTGYGRITNGMSPFISETCSIMYPIGFIRFFCFTLFKQLAIRLFLKQSLHCGILAYGTQFPGSPKVSLVSHGRATSECQPRSLGMARYSMVQHGLVGYGIVWYGMAWHGMV